MSLTNASLSKMPTTQIVQFSPKYEALQSRRWNAGTSMSVAMVDETLHGESKHDFHVRAEDITGASDDSTAEGFYDFILYPGSISLAVTGFYYFWLRMHLWYIMRQHEKEKAEAAPDTPSGFYNNKLAQANAATRVMLAKSLCMLFMTAFATAILEEIYPETDDTDEKTGAAAEEGLLAAMEEMWVAAMLVAVFAGIGVYAGMYIGQKFRNDFVDADAENIKGQRAAIAIIITSYTFVLHIVADIVDHEVDSDLIYIGIPVAFVMMALILYFVTPALAQSMTNHFKQQEKTFSEKLCDFGRSFIGKPNVETLQPDAEDEKQSIDSELTF